MNLKSFTKKQLKSDYIVLENFDMIESEAFKLEIYDKGYW